MKALLLMAALAACGGSDGVDLSGVYMVTADVSSSPCGTDMPTPSSPTYLKFTKMQVLGANVWTYDSCSDAAGTMCDNSGGIFGGFTEQIDNGWKGIESFDSFSGSTCELGYDERTALLKMKALVIESNDYLDMPMLDEAHCTTEEAEKRGKTMPCMMHERIEATQL